MSLKLAGQDDDLRVTKRETSTKDNQLQLEVNNTEKGISNKQNGNDIQIHPELRFVESEKHLCQIRKPIFKCKVCEDNYISK